MVCIQHTKESRQNPVSEQESDEGALRNAKHANPTDNDDDNDTRDGTSRRAQSMAYRSRLISVANPEAKVVDSQSSGKVASTSSTARFKTIAAIDARFWSRRARCIEQRAELPVTHPAPERERCAPPPQPHYNFKCRNTEYSVAINS